MPPASFSCLIRLRAVFFPRAAGYGDGFVEFQVHAAGGIDVGVDETLGAFYFDPEMFAERVGIDQACRMAGVL